MKEKRRHFLYRLFYPKKIFFNICVLSQCVVYGIHFQKIHSFPCQKTLLHTLLLLAFKIVKRLQCILHVVNLSFIFIPRISTNTYKIIKQALRKYKHQAKNISLICGTCRDALGILSMDSP